jgi:S1-C subfamily serine protease
MAAYYEPSGGYGEHRYQPGQATVPAAGPPARDPWNDPWAAPPPPTTEWHGYPGYYPPPPPPRRHPFRGLLVALLLLVIVTASGAALTRIFVTATGASRGTPSSGNAPGYGAPAPGGAPNNNGGGGAPLDAQSVAASVNPWVVNIETTLGLQQGGAAGTGIVLTSSGDVLTNNHVIAGSTSITGTDVGNGQTYQATVLGYDRSHDLAVIHLQGASKLRTAAIGDSSKVSVGDGIVAVGNAGGRGGTPAAVSGTVTALEQTITASDENGANAEQLTGLIQVAANIEPGDSGGPLVNAAGQAIGIDTAASTDFRFQASGGQGFAIPINQAVSVAKEIQTGKASSTVHIGATAFLGVQVTGSNGGGNGSGNGSGGAVVAGVVQGSPADSAGLSRGDVIISVDGTTIDTPSALTDALIGHHPGDRVTIGWVDQTGQSQRQSVRLTTGPAG